MCRKLIFLVSFIALLALVNSASAVEYDWTGAGNGASWGDPLNWDPTGIPGPCSTAVINPLPEQGPTIDCDVNVCNIHGPRWDSDSGNSMGVIAGNVVITEEWRWAAGGSGTATIDITGSPHITIGDRWRGVDEGTGILTITDGPTIDVGGDWRVCDAGDAWIVISVSGGIISTAGYWMLGDDGSGIVDISGGTIDIGDDWIICCRSGATWDVNMSGGVISVTDTIMACTGDGIATINMSAGTINAGNFLLPADVEGDGKGTLSMYGGFVDVNRHFEVGDYGTGHVQLCRGTIKTHTFAMRSHDGIGTMNICCEGRLIVDDPDGSVEANIKGYVRRGWITCIDAECPVVSVVWNGVDTTTVSCPRKIQYKDDIKWSQPPVEIEKCSGIIYGWDEESHIICCWPPTPIVADDWLCADSRPIKGIHWWGSFVGWNEPNRAPPPPEQLPDAFQIGIWTDVPDPNPGLPYTFSHPGEMIWEKISDCFVWSFAGYDLDPRGEDGNDVCFKFEMLLSQDEWFYQDPNVSQEILAGVPDDFAPPNEPASPGPEFIELVNYGLCNDLIDFDEVPVNRCFGHTFTGLPSCVVRAELEIRLKAASADGPSTDWLALELLDPFDPCLPLKECFAWLKDIKDLPLEPGGLPIGAWNRDDVNTFTLDLDNLPPSDSGVTSVLEHLADGDLDVLVTDDTGVDYIKLRVTGCGVYWLSIAAVYDIYDHGQMPDYPWGWKTRPHFCQDDAVRIATLEGGELCPTIGSVWESGEPIQIPPYPDPNGTSWDMTFVLTTNREYAPRKWRWPDEKAAAADIHEDGVINFKDFAILAEHWLEQAWTYPCVADTDGDGICDDSDNCPDVFNPDQNDADADGYGAACDCDDADPSTNPGAQEICGDGLDNDCDGVIDDGC